MGTLGLGSHLNPVYSADIYRLGYQKLCNATGKTAILGLPSGAKPYPFDPAVPMGHACCPHPHQILTTNMYCCVDLAVNSGLHSPMHRSTGPELIPGRACPISQTILEAERPQGLFGRRCQQCPCRADFPSPSLSSPSSLTLVSASLEEVNY